jgi:hypothetical protein
VKEFNKAMRVLKKKFEENKYVLKNSEGNPFFGETKIVFTDGKISHIKNCEEYIKL